MCLLLHECEEGCEKGLSLCSITIFQIRFEKNFILKKKKKKKKAPVQFYFKNLECLFLKLNKSELPLFKEWK